MRFGKPRARKTKSKSFLSGLIRLGATVSKTKGRDARLTRSIRIGPKWLAWSRSSTGREQLNVFGVTIPIYRRQKK